MGLADLRRRFGDAKFRPRRAARQAISAVGSLGAETVSLAPWARHNRLEGRGTYRRPEQHDLPLSPRDTL